MAVETSLGVHDRFNLLNIARWASCFFRVLHIIYVSVLVISIALSPCFSPCYPHSFLSHSCLLSFFISHSAFCHILAHLHSSSSSHLYYHLHFLTIHSSSFLSSLQIRVKTHTVTYARQWIHITHTQTHSFYIRMGFSIQLFHTNCENVNYIIWMEKAGTKQKMLKIFNKNIPCCTEVEKLKLESSTLLNNTNTKWMKEH